MGSTEDDVAVTAAANLESPGKEKEAAVYETAIIQDSMHGLAKP